MRQRNLLMVGVGAVVAAVLVGVTAAAIGLSGSGIARPGGMMGGFPGRGGGDIGIDRATNVAQGFAASYPDGRLGVDEVIEFSNGYYASIRERNTGVGAFEILIDPATGRVTREPGPDMMWNTRYGMVGGGMMGGAYTGAGAVSSAQARDLALRWLDGNQPGTTAKSPDRFHGYYTVGFEKDGKLVGMLSVNDSSGAVWFHSWHGSFVQVRDLGA